MAEKKMKELDVEGILLRDARSEDMPSMLEIFNEAVLNSTATFEHNPQTLEQRMKWFSNHGGKFPIVVVEVQGRVVGYCSLSSFRGRLWLCIHRRVLSLRA